MKLNLSVLNQIFVKFAIRHRITLTKYLQFQKPNFSWLTQLIFSFQTNWNFELFGVHTFTQVRFSNFSNIQFLFSNHHIRHVGLLETSDAQGVHELTHTIATSADLNTPATGFENY